MGGLREVRGVRGGCEGDGSWDGDGGSGGWAVRSEGVVMGLWTCGVGAALGVSVLGPFIVMKGRVSELGWIFFAWRDLGMQVLLWFVNVCMAYMVLGLSGITCRGLVEMIMGSPVKYSLLCVVSSVVRIVNKVPKGYATEKGDLVMAGKLLRFGSVSMSKCGIILDTPFPSIHPPKEYVQRYGP